MKYPQRKNRDRLTVMNQQKVSRTPVLVSILILSCLLVGNTACKKDTAKAMDKNAAKSGSSQKIATSGGDYTAYLPGNSIAAFSVDVQSMMKSELGKLAGAMLPKEEQTKCGFNPQKDMRHIVGSAAADKTFIMVLEGEKIGTKMPCFAKETGASDFKIEGNFFHGTAQGKAMTGMILNDNLLIVSSKNDKPLLTELSAKKQGLGSDLTMLLKKVNNKSNAWVVATGLDKLEETKSEDQLSQVVAAFTVDANLSINASVETASKESAMALKTKAETSWAQMKGTMLSHLPELSVGQKNTWVSISTKFTAEQIKKTVDLVRGFMGL